MKKKTTTDAVEILHRRHYKGRPGRERALEKARLNATIARDIYNLRTKAHLTQKQLAVLVGTTDSVISRLEDADYEGHSLRMLQRISEALHSRIEVRFVPLRGPRKVPA